MQQSMRRAIAVLLLCTLVFTAVPSFAGKTLSSASNRIPASYTYYIPLTGGCMIPLPSDSEFDPVTEWGLLHNIIAMGGSQSYTFILRRYYEISFDQMCASYMSNSEFECAGFSAKGVMCLSAKAKNADSDSPAYVICFEGDDEGTYVLELISGYSGKTDSSAKLWEVGDIVCANLILNSVDGGKDMY